MLGACGLFAILISISRFQTMSMYASTYMVVSLSIDRLDAIARPLNFKGSRT